MLNHIPSLPIIFYSSKHIYFVVLIYGDILGNFKYTTRKINILDDLSQFIKQNVQFMYKVVKKLNFNESLINIHTFQIFMYQYAI